MRGRPARCAPLFGCLLPAPLGCVFESSSPARPRPLSTVEGRDGASETDVGDAVSVSVSVAVSGVSGAEAVPRLCPLLPPLCIALMKARTSRIEARRGCEEDSEEEEEEAASAGDVTRDARNAALQTLKVCSSSEV